MQTTERDVTRWYILMYIGDHDKAVKQLSAVEELKFYAPVMFEHKHHSKSETRVFLNYAFVFGSQNYIYELKQISLPSFNFMRSKTENGIVHPYVSDLEIEQMKKVEQYNGGQIPLMLSNEDILVGDKIEILSGNFKGYKATAVTRNGSKYRQVYLNIGDMFTIPLCKLTKQEFRIIQYADPEKHNHDFYLPEERVTAIINAVRRFYGMPTDDDHNADNDTKETSRLIGLCESQKLLTINNRLKVQSLLALAYMLQGDKEQVRRHLNLANPLMQEKVTMVARLYFATLRYLATGFPEHFTDYRTLKNLAIKSLPQGAHLMRFIHCAEELFTHKTEQASRKKQSISLPEDDTQEHWFCISAPKKKTEAVRLFRDKDIPLNILIVSGKDQKNVLKDLFFVNMTYDALIALRNENHGAFSILSQSVGYQKRFYTYSDEDIKTFEYVNSLDIPNKEIIVYTPERETIVIKSQKRTIPLGEREVEGHHMTLHSGKKTQEKVVFLLRGVAAIAVTL